MSRPIGLCMLFAVCVCASAQVTLSTVQGGVATPAGEFYYFGSVALGAAANVEFRLTNTGAASVYLTSLALAGPYGQDFPVVCAVSPQLCGNQPRQQLPILINPTGTLDFTLQFEPFQLGSPSATLTINAGNALSLIVSGTGVPGLTVLLDNQPLGAGETVGFGAVEVGASQTIKLILANPASNVTIGVPAIPPLAGGAFSLAGSALGQPAVAPGSSAELDVIFSPTAMGAQAATLTIGLLTYPLQGTGAAPPPPIFPAPSVEIVLASSTSAQQGSISVSLASGSLSSGSGVVTLAFQSAVSGVSDDPTVTFADGTRSAVFTVAEGAASGQFANAPTVAFGTGTTAGTLVFSVTLGGNTAQNTVVIPASAIGIDAAVPARNVGCDPALVYCTATNIQLQINGWDNSRSVSEIVFSFFDSSGNAIAPGNITVNAGSAFEQYFAASGLAGVFGISAFFPITGDSDQVVAALVQITNAVGTVESARITF